MKSATNIFIHPTNFRIPRNLPPNILVRTFLPQQSILAHPKTLLFVTHVGNNGLLEAVHYRVPMVGMPII